MWISKGVYRVILFGMCVLLLAISGCTFMDTLTGRVVDIRSSSSQGMGLEGVAVLVQWSGGEAMVSTNYDGYWYAMVIPGEIYSISYSKDGYYIPSGVSEVSLGKENGTVVPAVPVVPQSSSGLDFVLVWENEAGSSPIDLDLYFTYPNATYSPGTGLNTPNETGYSSNNGFGPMGVETQRTKVGSGMNQSNRAKVYGNTKDGIQSIQFNIGTVGGSAFLPGEGQRVTPSTQNGLPTDNGDYYWNGIGQLYVGILPKGSNISPANARLYVFETTDTRVALQGVFPLPTDTYLGGGVSIARINFLRGMDSSKTLYYQLVPDITSIPGGSDYFFNKAGSL